MLEEMQKYNLIKTLKKNVEKFADTKKSTTFALAIEKVASWCGSSAG